MTRLPFVALLVACVVSLGTMVLGIVYLTARVCDTGCPDRTTLGYVLTIGGGIAFVVLLLAAILRGTQPNGRRGTRSS